LYKIIAGRQAPARSVKTSQELMTPSECRPWYSI